LKSFSPDLAESVLRFTLVGPEPPLRGRKRMAV
jgi:hypothetical protein